VQFGDDEFGHMLVNILKQNGVNAEGCLFDEHARTALAFVTLKTNGEREFMFYRNPSADMLLTADELNVDLLKRVNESYHSNLYYSHDLIVPFPTGSSSRHLRDLG
jgi:fructokinase